MIKFIFSCLEFTDKFAHFIVFLFIFKNLNDFILVYYNHQVKNEFTENWL